MTQERRPDGKFGGKATDITKQDIKKAIQFVTNDLEYDAKVVLKQPPARMKVDAKVQTQSSVALPEFVLYAIIVTAITVFLFACTMYVWARV